MPTRRHAPGAIVATALAPAAELRDLLAAVRRGISPTAVRTRPIPSTGRHPPVLGMGPSRGVFGPGHGRAEAVTGRPSGAPRAEEAGTASRAQACPERAPGCSAVAAAMAAAGRAGRQGGRLPVDARRRALAEPAA